MRKPHLFAIILACILNFTFVFGGGVRNYSWMTIKNSDGKCMTAVNAEIKFLPCEANNNNQAWFYTPQSELRFRLSDNDLSAYCVDLPTDSGGQTLSQLQLYTCGDHPSSSWRLISAQEVTPSVKVKLINYWAGQKNQCLASRADDLAGIDNCDAPSSTTLTINPENDAKSIYDVLPEAALVSENIHTHSWMHDIFKHRPDVKLSQVIIPGTHNSATIDFYNISRTQGQPILAQLYDGIRYLDLRTDVRWYNNLVVTHGKECGAPGSVDAALAQIKLFAEQHPREIIVLDLHEIPLVKDENDVVGLNNIRKLARSLDALKDLFIAHKVHSSELTFRKLWREQDRQNHNRNILLVVRNAAYFEYAGERELHAYMINRKTNLWEEWPDTTDIKDIYSKNTSDLADRNLTPDRAALWHMSQIIRTPTVGDFIITTFFAASSGPLTLVREKTLDGYFNNMLASWLNEWVHDMKLVPNLLMVDFYDLTRVVPMSLWLNFKRMQSFQ